MKKIILLLTMFICFGATCFATIPTSQMAINGIVIGSNSYIAWKTFGGAQYIKQTPDGKSGDVYYFCDGMPSSMEMTSLELRKAMISRTKFLFSFKNDAVIYMGIHYYSSEMPLKTDAGIYYGAPESSINVYGTADKVGEDFKTGGTDYTYYSDDMKWKMTFYTNDGIVYNIIIRERDKA